MLKKTGIIVATIATGLIGLSPLAFADDWGFPHHGADKVQISEDNDTNTKTDNSIDRKQYNHCAFIQDQDASSVVDGGGLTDAVPAVDDLPVVGDQDQDQEANCTNVGDTVGAATPLT